MATQPVPSQKLMVSTIHKGTGENGIVLPIFLGLRNTIPVHALITMYTERVTIILKRLFFNKQEVAHTWVFCLLVFILIATSIVNLCTLNGISWNFIRIKKIAYELCSLKCPRSCLMDFVCY